MQTQSYDILRTDALGQAIWIDAVVINFRFKPNEFHSLTHVVEDRLSG